MNLMRDEDASGAFSRQSAFRTQTFVEEMETDVCVDGAQGVVEEVDVRSAVDGTG